ncbi:exopolysaccharide biosynthesis polyprenyl glycosylphosphotransferase [Streptomyces sp. C10-9-1]|uniref:exopolysaccharide biosynthesis polyprenyl glycosylphosphotransferase n=1 Tax=Streptomyces sp. C10-9-1 TaxID=1859285 RepID=UPI003D729E00
MTTESAPVPHTAPVAATRRAPSLHASRRSAGRRPAAHARRRIRQRGRPVALLAVDAAAAAAAAAAVPGPERSLLPAMLLLATSAAALHAWRGLYRGALSPSALAELPTLLLASAAAWILLGEALAADGSGFTGAGPLAGGAALQTLLACAGRAAVHHGRRRFAARRPHSALVVGDGAVARQVTAALYAHPGYGMRPVGRVAPGRRAATEDTGTLPVLVTGEDVSRAVIQNAVTHALFTAPPSAGLVRLFADHGCRTWLVDGGAAEGVVRPRPAHPDHLWGFSVQPLPSGSRPLGPARSAKRALDALLAAVVLVVAAPVLGVCALAVRLADGPGVIFRQERIGLGGRPFTLLKFRTLRPADEHESATRWNVARDRRMSATGSLLRRTSLDELPQLWNVLRGDMSLVGPRPERPYFVAQFTRAYPGYGDRHRMPVGITGLAQVNGLRGDTSIEERARFDNHYIDTWSLWQDVCIMARTAASLFRLGGS